MRASTLDCEAVTGANRHGEGPNVNASNGAPPCGSRFSNGLFESGGIELRQFAPLLSSYAERVVLDDTKLPGRWEFTLRFSSQPSVAASSADDPPSIFTALQEQLGLKLEPSRALQTLVIEHLERPSENQRIRLKPDTLYRKGRTHWRRGRIRTRSGGGVRETSPWQDREPFSAATPVYGEVSAVQRAV